MIEIRGEAPKVERLRTGWYSFDRAFINSEGDIGFPIGKGLELYGPNASGKSTVAYSLAGIVAKSQKEDIALADLEGFDPDYLSAILEHKGFDGIIELISEKTDEDILDELIKKLYENCCVGILDSIGAIAPIAEVEGEIGERNMGQRAFNMAQFSRKGVRLLRESKVPRTIIATNHAYPRIGGLGKDTPGGEVKKYLFSMRIDMKRVWTKSGEVEFPDGSYVIEGMVAKNRWGIRKRKFNLFILSGKGVDKNLTAVYDCLVLKLAKKSRVIKIEDTSYGYLKDIVREARNNNTMFFEPFFELLAKHEEEHETENLEREEDTNGDSENNGDED